MLVMHSSDIALLRRKHAEYLRLEAVARRKAAGMPNPDERTAWKALANSWRELANQAEAMTGMSAVTATAH